MPNSPHAILETKANAEIVQKTRIPKTADYANGDPLEEIVDYPYPFSGNGMPASRDGHVLPEFRPAGGSPVQMTASANAASPPITTLRFRFDDGQPYAQTIAGQTASDWMLIVDPADPDNLMWVPIP